MEGRELRWERLTAPVAVPTANGTAAELDLAESGHPGSGHPGSDHRDHCKPQSLLRASGMRAGGVSEALAHSARRKLMRALCPGGEEGLCGGSPQDRLLFGPPLPSVGVRLLLNTGLAARPQRVQLVRWGDFWLFLPVSPGVVGGLGQG